MGAIGQMLRCEKGGGMGRVGNWGLTGAGWAIGVCLGRGWECSWEVRGAVGCLCVCRAGGKHGGSWLWVARVQLGGKCGQEELHGAGVG